MNETKYRNLFIIDLKASANDFDNEFKRVIKENGYSEELKKKFYFAAFESIIGVNKKTLVEKNEFYKDNVIALYDLFINALKEDGIDYSSIEEKRENFEHNEFPLLYDNGKNLNTYNADEGKYVPTYKTFNPNTRYGRKKALEQARRNYENGTDEDKNEIDNIRIVLWLIVGVIGVLFLIFKAKFL